MLKSANVKRVNPDQWLSPQSHRGTEIKPSWIALMLCTLLLAITACDAQTLSPSPDFGSDFWEHWGDGKAELAGYDVTYPRYGTIRNGTGVSIFVTEDFADSLRVKADPGKHPKSDVYPVIKLNLVEDFPTGLYDYNLMTSVFVRADNTKQGGLPVKASFSAQEWCGHAYAQLLFDKDTIRLTSHSYFDGEADQNHKLRQPDQAFSEDVLLHWARSLASPVLKPGQTVKVNMLRSLAHSRLRHQPLQWVDATLSFDPKPVTVIVPAGTFTCDKLTCTLADGMTWAFYIDRDSPYRPIIQWESSAGHKGSLIKSKRLAYWKLHDEGNQSILTELGLKPREMRMP
jgi:hypothetical protein